MENTGSGSVSRSVSDGEVMADDIVVVRPVGPACYIISCCIFLMIKFYGGRKTKREKCGYIVPLYLSVCLCLYNNSEPYDRSPSYLTWFKLTRSRSTVKVRVIGQKFTVTE